MTFPDDFITVLVSTVGGVTYDHNQIKIKLRDDLEFLDEPVLNDTFGGTGGADGDEAVEGFPKQRSFYYNSFIPPQLCDAQKLIYLIGNDYLDGVGEGDDYNWDERDSFIAFDGGVPYIRDADYSTIRELENIPPDPGRVRFLVAEGQPNYMRLGSTPEFDLRVVVPGLSFGTGLNNTYYQVTDLIDEIPGVTVSSSTGPYVTGRLVTDSDETYTDFFSDFLKAHHSNLWSTRTGDITCESFNITSSGTSVYTFTENNTTSMKFEKLLHAYKIIVNHGEAFGGSTAEGADEDIKGELAKSGYYETYTFENSSIKTLHKLARVISINTKTWLGTTEVAEAANRYYEQYNDKEIVNVTVRGTFTEDLLNIDINQVVTIDIPRFGLTGGKNFTVIGVRHDYKQNLMSFKLWG